MTVGFSVLACRHAHEPDKVDGGGGATPPTDGGGADGVDDPDPRPPTDVDAAARDDPKPAEPRIGPIRRAAPFVFVPHPGAATLARVAKSLRAAAVGSTADLRVELGCPTGARVVARAKAAKVPLAKKDETRTAVVDPGGQWIAIELAPRRVDAFTSAAPRRLGSWPGDRPLALASDLLVVRDECRWLAVDPSKPTEPPRVLADALCGEPIHVDAAARRIAIAETPTEGASVRAIVALADGAEPQRRELPADVTAAAISADGKILCAVFGGAAKPLLQCRPIEGGTFERVAQGVEGPLRFAADAPRLAFAVKSAGDGLDLHVVDFEQRFVRKLGKVHQHRFTFLPGGERLAAYEGGRGIVFELDSGFMVPFGGREDDWASIVPLPSTHDAFLATRLVKRCVELVRIDLPQD